MKLSTGAIASGPIVDNAITQDEWIKEGNRRFGSDFKKWKFVCPKCKHIASIQEFVDLGLDPNDAYQECIGRHVGGKGCDWAAYGLFGTLGNGRIVKYEKDGKEVGMEVFDFAPVEEGSDA